MLLKKKIMLTTLNILIKVIEFNNFLIKYIIIYLYYYV